MDDETIPQRLLARYPPADITSAQFEDFVAELLGAAEPGLENFRVRTHEVIEGVDGTYDFDATVRYRSLGMDFLIVAEAKQHTNPIKRGVVQVLHSKAQSVGAQKAVLIATAHFQQGALTYARTHGIALVVVTEGRFTWETKAVGPDPELSREQASAFGIPELVGVAFGAGDTENTIRMTVVDPGAPDRTQESLFGLEPSDG